VRIAHVTHAGFIPICFYFFFLVVHISSLYTPISESSHFSKHDNHMLSEARVEPLICTCRKLSTGVAKGSGMPQKDATEARELYPPLCSDACHNKRQHHP
jgi:hypothetical protein